MLAFIFTNVIPLREFFYFLVWLQVSLVSSYFGLKSSFQHLLQGRSTSDKLPQLLLIWECLNLSFIFEEFCQIQNSWLTVVFSSGTLNTSSHCFLASMVSDEKWVVNLIKDHSYVTSCFFLATFKIFCLCFLTI